MKEVLNRDDFDNFKSNYTNRIKSIEGDVIVFNDCWISDGDKHLINQNGEIYHVIEYLKRNNYCNCRNCCSMCVNTTRVKLNKIPNINDTFNCLYGYDIISSYPEPDPEIIL
jgi:signal peptidase I